MTSSASLVPPLLYMHAAIVINHREVDIIPASSEEAALDYLRERAEVWEESLAVPGLDRRTATLEQLNLLFADGDPTHECMVTIGTFESPYIQPSLLHTSAWRWREEDGCLVAGKDQEYILLPGPTVSVAPAHRALIAAAPDLLAACEAVLEAWSVARTEAEVGVRLGFLVPKLRAALGKAHNVEKGTS